MGDEATPDAPGGGAYALRAPLMLDPVGLSLAADQLDSARITFAKNGRAAETPSSEAATTLPGWSTTAAIGEVAAMWAAKSERFDWQFSDYTSALRTTVTLLVQADEKNSATMPGGN